MKDQALKIYTPTLKELIKFIKKGQNKSAQQYFSKKGESLDLSNTILGIDDKKKETLIKIFNEINTLKALDKQNNLYNVKARQWLFGFLYKKRIDNLEEYLSGLNQEGEMLAKICLNNPKYVEELKGLSNEEFTLLTKITNLDFSNCSFRGAIINQVDNNNFSNCDFAEANFMQNIENSNFTGAHFIQSQGAITFTKCQFSFANLKQAAQRDLLPKGANFKDCQSAARIINLSSLPLTSISATKEQLKDYLTKIKSDRERIKLLAETAKEAKIKTKKLLEQNYTEALKIIDKSERSEAVKDYWINYNKNYYDFLKLAPEEQITLQEKAKIKTKELLEQNLTEVSKIINESKRLEAVKNYWINYNENYHKILQLKTEEGIKTRIMQETASIISFNEYIKEEKKLNDINIIADLSKLDLSIWDLSYANFSGSNFAYCDLSGHLTGACFDYAYMEGVDIVNAEASGTSFKYANLIGSNLSDTTNFFQANFTGANLEGSNFFLDSLCAANLTNANCRGANFEDVDAEQLEAKGAIFDNANLVNMNLKQAQLQFTSFKGALMNRINLETANLEGAILQDVQLIRANLKKAFMQQADMHRANLTRAFLAQANLEKTNLKGTILNFVQAEQVHFTQAILDGVEMQFSLLTEACMDEVSAKFINLCGTQMNKASAIGIDLDSACLKEIRVQEANFTKAIMTKVDGYKADLTKAILTGVNAQESQFVEAIFIQANMTRMDLRNASVAGANLHSANLHELKTNESTDWKNVINKKHAQNVSDNVNKALITQNLNVLDKIIIVGKKLIKSTPDMAKTIYKYTLTGIAVGAIAGLAISLLLISGPAGALSLGAVITKLPIIISTITSLSALGGIVGSYKSGSLFFFQFIKSAKNWIFNFKDQDEVKSYVNNKAEELKEEQKKNKKVAPVAAPVGAAASPSTPTTPQPVTKEEEPKTEVSAVTTTHAVPTNAELGL